MCIRTGSDRHPAQASAEVYNVTPLDLASWAETCTTNQTAIRAILGSCSHSSTRRIRPQGSVVKAGLSAPCGALEKVEMSITVSCCCGGSDDRVRASATLPNTQQLEQTLLSGNSGLMSSVGAQYTVSEHTTHVRPTLLLTSPEDASKPSVSASSTFASASTPPANTSPVVADFTAAMRSCRTSRRRPFWCLRARCRSESCLRMGVQPTGRRITV
jgi:hypothetical protein